MYKTISKWITQLVFFVTLTSCSSPIVNDDHSEEFIDKPDQESWDVRITITNSGIKRADIKADYLEQFSDKMFISLKDNVQIDFFDAKEQHMSKLLANKAEINERSTFLQAIDNITVMSDSGITLYTDTLSWDNSREIIFTTDSVMITTETSDTLYGIGFESDVNMERWKILKPRGVTSR